MKHSPITAAADWTASARALLSRLTPARMVALDLLTLAESFDHKARVRASLAEREGPAMASATGNAMAASAYRYMAADCRSAAEGCEVSLHSVMEWLDDQGELA